jgi:NAD+ kinase
MHIALYGNHLRPEHLPVLKRMLTILEGKNIVLSVFGPLQSYLSEVLGFSIQVKTFKDRSGLAEDLRVLVALGGDGTTLRAAQLVGDSGIPILGINLGRLGFLAAVTTEQAEEALLKLVNRDFQIESRTILQAEVAGKLLGSDTGALNDITVMKKDSSSMVTIQTWINGSFFNTYWADGLIISTPTGSTGYSLSCGGPILLPESPSLVLTPIAPHNLNVRPVVIPDTAKLRLLTESRTQDYLLSLDSRSYTLPTNTVVEIHKGSYQIQLVRFEENSFMEALRSKLLWGLDKRN